MPIELTLALIGLVFAVGGSIFVRTGRRRSATKEPVAWIPAHGTIVDWEIRRVGSDWDSDLAFPVVEYLAPDGRTHRFTNPTTFDTGFYPKGKPVSILIDPTDTARAQLANTAATARMLGALHLIMGVIFVVVGILLMVAGGSVWWLFGR